MRILFFHPLTGRYWRGIERIVVALASTLVRQGHDVSVLTLRHPERALIEQLDSRVHVYAAPRSKYYAYMAAVPHFAAHLMRHRYDAVIVFFGGFGIGPALALARCARDIPLFLCPAYPVDVAPHRYDEIERWGLDRAAVGLWAQGQHVARGASARLRRNVFPLPQGVDTCRFYPDRDIRARVRAALGIETDAPVILTVSALNERKGIQHVIEAMPDILSAFPDVRYVVAGEGEMEESLRSRTCELGLGNAVHLLGPRENVEELYQAADVFCLLSRGEANPMVVYEALASGLPLVTLDCPPFPEMLDSSVAVLLPTTETQVVADALIELLGQPERRAAMGAAGRRRVEERYSFDALGLLLTGLILEAHSGMQSADMVRG